MDETLSLQLKILQYELERKYINWNTSAFYARTSWLHFPGILCQCSLSPQTCPCKCDHTNRSCLAQVSLTYPWPAQNTEKKKSSKMQPTCKTWQTNSLRSTMASLRRQTENLKHTTISWLFQTFVCSLTTDRRKRTLTTQEILQLVKENYNRTQRMSKCYWSKCNKHTQSITAFML